ncbi:MAG: thioredoxin family protein [Miltoncostaeaceae bacterium]
MSVRAVTDGDWDEVVLGAGPPVLVDAHAPWCRPCEAVHGLVADAAARHAGRLLTVSLDIDANPRTAGRYDILGVPTLLIFRHGDQVGRVTGRIRRSSLESALVPVLDQE